MTDELEQAPAEEQPTGEVPADEFVGGEVSGFNSADSAMAASIPTLDDVNLKNAKKAGEWVWDHTFGERHKQVEPEGINIEYEDEEEVTMRSTWVEHDDPPPPPPPDEHPTPPAHTAPPAHPAEHEKRP